MSDIVSKLFGFLVVFSSVALFIWEYQTYQFKSDKDAWIITSTRKRRRYLMAGLLFVVGFLLILETQGVINLKSGNLKILSAYVLTLALLAITLLVLAFQDVKETADNAQKLALDQVKEAIKQSERVNQNPPEDE